MRFVPAIAVGVGLIVLAVAGLSQGSTRAGTLKGTVLQQVFCVRAPCPPLRKGGVEITARRRDARTRTATADKRGRFRLRVRPGRWRLTAATGGQRAAATVQVHTGRTSRVRLVLR